MMCASYALELGIPWRVFCNQPGLTLILGSFPPEAKAEEVKSRSSGGEGGVPSWDAYASSLPSDWSHD